MSKSPCRDTVRSYAAILQGFRSTAAARDLPALAARLGDIAEALLDMARERGELRQRVLLAEQAARVTMDQCRASNISFSKILMRHALTMAERERDAARAALERISRGELPAEYENSARGYRLFAFDALRPPPEPEASEAARLRDRDARSIGPAAQEPR